MGDVSQIVESYYSSMNSFFKGIVQPKMKITPWFTLKSTKVYMNFFFQMKTIRVLLKNVLALPSFIMPVNGVEIFKPPKKCIYPS